VGNYVHSVSNDVSYCAISTGSVFVLFVSITVNVLFSGLAVVPVVLFTGYSRHLGDVSMSISPEWAS
jgi:hypothetical protein